MQAISTRCAVKNRPGGWRGAGPLETPLGAACDCIEVGYWGKLRPVYQKSELFNSFLDMTNFKVAELQAGMKVPAGERWLSVSPELAAAYKAGDSLLPILNKDGDALLHIPAAERELVGEAVARAADSFSQMASVGDDQITAFYEAFAARLEDDEVWKLIETVNAADVQRAKEKGRSTTRLEANEKMRRGMIDGLRQWRDAPAARGRVLETIQHEGWKVEQIVAALGVVGFVFEGRPNVFADATGVLRGGNTVVFRIGSDALGTARAIVSEALAPSLQETGLPSGAAVLIESAQHAAGWALFSDARLSLAVARGSGRATSQLGSVARHAGVPVSLHGTGGAWIVADGSADIAKFEAAIEHSLDRKVCNTLNTLCIPRGRADDLIPAMLRALTRAGEKRGQGFKLHIVEGSKAFLPSELFATKTTIRRAAGDVNETIAETLPETELAREWEWEETPEISLVVVEDLKDAVQLFNRYSPQFVASLIAEDEAAHETFYQIVNAPFVGNGFTRWVDGQYALQRPELGLSNWEAGRLFARCGVLAGDGVFSIRTRVTQTDFDVHR